MFSETVAFVFDRHSNGFRDRLKPYADTGFRASPVAMLHGVGGRLRHNGFEILDTIRWQAIQFVQKKPNRP